MVALRAELAAERAARVAAEARADAAEARLHQISELLPVTMLLLSAEGRIELLNRAYGTLFQLPDAVCAALVGQQVAALFPLLAPHLADPTGFTARSQTISAGGQTVLADPVALADGRRMERDYVRRPDGGWLLTYRDVTARDQARHDQRRAEVRAAQIVREVRIGLLLVNEDDEIVLINQQYCDLFGLPDAADALLGTSGEALLRRVSPLYPHPAQRRRQVLAQRAAGRNVFNELLPLTDGRTLERDYIILDPDANGYAGQLACYRDVTEREQARRAQRRSEARVALMLNALQVGLVLFDAGGHVLLLNEALLKLLGLETDLRPAALAGISAADLLTTLLPAFAAPEQVQAWAQIVPRGGIPVRDLQLALVGGRMLEFDIRPLDESAGSGWLVAARDVTAREAREAELRTASQIPEQDPNPLVRLNADGEVLYANPAAWRVLDALPDEARDGMRARNGIVAREALADGVPRQRESTLGPRRYQTVIVPFQAEAYINIYMVDVTARRAAEEQVAAQRAFYELILDSLPADVAVFDADLRYVYLNPQAQADPAMRAWILGRSYADYYTRKGLPLSDSERRRQVLTEARDTGRIVSWEDILPPSSEHGKPRTLRRFVRPTYHPDGSPHLLIGYGVDVTAVVEAQRAIAAQRTFYESILDHLPSDVAVLDAELRYRYLNPQAVRNPEMRQWLIGRTDFDYAARRKISTERAEARLVVLRRALASRQIETWEEGLPQADGSTHYLRRYVQAVYEPGPDGPLRLLIGYGVDVTAIRQAQRAAEDSARARENFLANMSHEIRTPMNGVLGMAALLAKTPLNEQQREFVDTLRTSGRHLLMLVDDVLDLAKINSGKLELEQTAFDLSAALRVAVQTLHSRADEKNLYLVARPLALTNPWMLGDPHRLNQILLNLISNALKFTDHGGVTVYGRVVRETAETVTVTLLVEDSGIGIAPDKQAAVFEDFTQAYADTTRRYGGTGLGLTISRALAEQMGGVLRLSSMPGEGTTFGLTLTLPRTTPPAVPPPAEVARLAAAVPDVPLAGVRVLLVEDHDVNRQVAELLLQHLGATIDAAASGPEALALAQVHCYDVVLMDIQMPGMSGLDVTAALRRDPDPQRAQLPIIALTANAFASDRARYLAAGMDACLTKPFEEVELVRLVRTLLHQPPLAPLAPAPPAEEAPVPLVPDSDRPVFPATLLRLGHGDRVFARRILDSFRASTPDLLVRLNAALEAGDGPVAAEIAHRLVPTIRMLDAPDLAAILVEIELLPATDPAWPDTVAFATQELAEVLAQVAAFEG